MRREEEEIESLNCSPSQSPDQGSWQNSHKTNQKVGAKEERRARKEARSSAGCVDGGVEGSTAAAADSAEAEDVTPPFSILIFSSSRILFSRDDLKKMCKFEKNRIQYLRCLHLISHHLSGSSSFCLFLPPSNPTAGTSQTVDILWLKFFASVLPSIRGHIGFRYFGRFCGEFCLLLLRRLLYSSLSSR